MIVLLEHLTRVCLCVCACAYVCMCMCVCLGVPYVDQEYFIVTKVAWAKCSMSFNFANLVSTRNFFNSGNFITRSFSMLR